MNFRDIWIFMWIPSIVLNKCKMADLDISSSDSESEFTGFSTEDIQNTSADYVPDSDPDSDITISSVNSSDLTDLGETDGENGDGDNVAPEWTSDFGEIEVEPFVQESGPNFDPARWHPIDYFYLLFEPQMFAEIANYTNSYATFKCDERRRQQNEPEYTDTKWHETTPDEI